MNIVLLVLQVLLALHTIMGAIWKFSNPAEIIPSLQAIPPNIWLGLSGLELVCSLGLLLPLVVKRLAVLAPVSAALIAAEMLLFCGLHFASSDGSFGSVIYWLVVAALCGFIIYGRSARKSV